MSQAQMQEGNIHATLERAGEERHVAVVTMTRPAVLNAYDEVMLQQLEQIWDTIRDDDDIWVAIITGEGRAFSVGHDIRWMKNLDVRAEAVQPQYHGGSRTRYLHGYGAYGVDIGKPLIAAIEGYCVGGGFAMALACDIRVAGESAVFAVSQPKRGVISPYACAMLPRLIGHSQAAKVLLTAEDVSAKRAYEIGLVHDVVADGRSLEASLHMADELCELAPLALRGIKEALHHAMVAPPETALQVGHRIFGWLRGTEDSAEGAIAFTEKRSPRWRGR